MNLKLLLVCTCLMLISSCVNNSQTVEISSNQNLPATFSNDALMDDWTIRLDTETLEMLKQSNNYFLMYLGNPTCSSCTRFKPQLITWIYETNAMVYYLDTLEQLHALPSIQMQFPHYFPEGFSTPSLYIFLGEERIHRIVASEAFFSYPRFKSLMASYISIQE